ncbi:MAG: homoserine dehydrogenase [Planctomycetaceae bacterium]|nr:homoserine dehydrogenase [Planctomycetaceae bacterium]
MTESAGTEPLGVGIIGLGTVGSGVARVLLEHPERMQRRAGRPVVLRKAVVRDLSRSRGIELPAGMLTDQVDEVLNDPETGLVVELIGGLSPAREFVERALKAGKDVVTANKALIYEHGDALCALAREQGKTIAFEAAVAAGVPIIGSVGQALAANQITGIEAVLNGTSNFILTEMSHNGLPYDAAVQLAQERGYAEADPSMDVDGTDAAHKLVILTQLAFGTRVPLDAFIRQGIDTLELADLQYARELGYRVKLLAVARIRNGLLEMHVEPTLIRRGHPMSTIEDVYNRIQIDGDVVGRVWFSGMGAGQAATASAVVADLIDTASGRTRLNFPLLDLWHQREPVPVLPADELSRRYYLRYNVIDRPHMMADVTDILGRQGISIASVMQHEAPEIDCTSDSDEEPIVPLVIMTHRTTEGQMRSADREIAQLQAVRMPRVRMPVDG